MGAAGGRLGWERTSTWTGAKSAFGMRRATGHPSCETRNQALVAVATVAGRPPQKNTGDLQWEICANYNARPCADEKKGGRHKNNGEQWKNNAKNNAKNNGNRRKSGGSA